MKPTMKPYDKFYRDYGVRTASQLPDPPTHSLEELVLPMNSAFHWFGYDHSEQVGLSQDDQIAQGIKRYIYATNVEEYVQADVVGEPKDLPLITTSMTRQYFSENRKIKRLKNGIETINDPYSLVVYNYGLLNDHYRYTGVTAELDRWQNYYRTVYNNIAREVVKSDRQHFVEFEVPEVVPPLSILNRCEEGVDIKVARKIPSDEWTIAEMYHLITYQYKAYIFKDIATRNDVLNKINLIIRCGDVFSVVNLGKLIEWGGEDEKEKIKGRTKIAKRFLRAMLSIRAKFSLGPDSPKALTGEMNIADISDSDEDDDVDDTEGKFSKQIEVEDDAEDGVVEDDSLDIDPFSSIRPKKTTKVEKVEKVDDTKLSKREDIDSQIEDELDQLEEYANEADSFEEISAYKTYEPKNIKPQEAVVEHAKEFAEIGLLTPAEVNGIEKLSKKVYDIKSPFDPNKSLVDSLEISKEELDVDNIDSLTGDIKGVTDESMKKSTLTVFNEKYINNTMQKDIGNMILNIQKAGIAISDFKVEDVINIKDEYRIYKVKVHPIGASPSTITIKLPIVHEDGTFMVNEKRVRTRRQRGELPISKTSPSEVALTSYYSKLFVYRSARKQYNYSAWIVNSIVSKSLNGEDITDIKYSNVTDPDKRVPRAYSALAQRVTSLKTNNATWHFDVNKLNETFGEEYSDSGRIPVAKLNDGRVLYLDDDDYVYTLDGGKPSEKEHISVALGLDASKRPRDYVETKIFGKPIPVGIILAYQVGLGNLLKTIGTKSIKKLGRRERYKLADHEWELKFKDYKLIFSDQGSLDKRTSLIMHGLKRVEKVLSKHSIYDYDKRINYNALLTSLGVPPRYLKEIPLMFDLWVDPITQEVLREMNEPEDLFSLFMRATELLLDDKYNDPTDVAFMRDKGYERHAGIMYGELIREVRKFKNRPLSIKNKLDLHPEAVWSAVTRDSSNDPVRDLNPVHELKEQEVVVYRGEGGRSSQSMMPRNRRFHKNSLGSTSEATVDNGDTGTIVYSTFNPNYTSVRGLTKPAELDDKNRKPSQLISTSMLLAPGAENDDKLIA